MRQITLTEAAYKAICGLVQPSDEIDPTTVEATDEIWGEIRSAFPAAAYRAESRVDQIIEAAEGLDNLHIPYIEPGAITWKYRCSICDGIFHPDDVLHHLNFERSKPEWPGQLTWTRVDDE